MIPISLFLFWDRISFLASLLGLVMGALEELLVHRVLLDSTQGTLVSYNSHLSCKELELELELPTITRFAPLAVATTVTLAPKLPNPYFRGLRQDVRLAGWQYFISFSFFFTLVFPCKTPCPTFLLSFPSNKFFSFIKRKNTPKCTTAKAHKETRKKIISHNRYRTLSKYLSNLSPSKIS